jgi:hypothetical protein
MPDALVVNASPLIFLGNAGRLDLLRVIGASRVVVPQSVFDEVTKHAARGSSGARGCGGRLDRTRGNVAAAGGPYAEHC